MITETGGRGNWSFSGSGADTVRQTGVSEVYPMRLAPDSRRFVPGTRSCRRQRRRSVRERTQLPGSPRTRWSERGPTPSPRGRSGRHKYESGGYIGGGSLSSRPLARGPGTTAAPPATAPSGSISSVRLPGPGGCSCRQPGPGRRRADRQQLQDGRQVPDRRVQHPPRPQGGAGEARGRRGAPRGRRGPRQGGAEHE